MIIHQWFERFNMNITVCWQSSQCLPSTAALRNANMEGFPQTTGNTHEQKGQIRVSQKTWEKKKKSQPSSGTRFFGQMKPRLTCTRIMGRDECWESKEQLAIQSTLHHLSNIVEAMLRHVHVWLPMELGRECLLMMWLLTEIAGCILKCIEPYYLLRFSQMLQNW